MRCPQTPNGTRHRLAGTQPTQLSSCFAGTTFSGSGDSKPRWGCWKHTGPSSSHSNSKRVVKDRTEASLQRQRTQGPGSPESRHQALASTTVAGGTALPHRGWDRGVRLLHWGALRCRRGKSFPHRAAAFSTGAEGQQARGQRKEGLCHQGPPPPPVRPTGGPTLPAHTGDAQRQPTRCHLLIVIVETVHWLLVLSIHPALFAGTKNSSSSVSCKIINQQTRGSNDGTTTLGASSASRGTQCTLDMLSNSSSNSAF